MKKVNIALVGLGFGGAFSGIYKAHPNVGKVKLFDVNQELQEKFAQEIGADGCYRNFQELLNDTEIDAVHLVTPIPLHADQTIQVLESGKHCACTVPMAIRLEDIYKITKTVRQTKKIYMMMETSLFTYQFFYVKDMIESGKLGRIQFLRGSHYQDMSGWPKYWMGLPPMYYGTHAIAPMVSLSNSRIKKVHCFGSGLMDKQLTEQYKNPYPIESAIFEFENGLKGEATRSLFETARMYQEGMFVYGSKASFEWGFRDEDNPYITIMKPCKNDMRGNYCECKTVQMPNYYKMLPKEIQHFTVGGNFDPLNPQKTLKIGAGAGHHGSHAHLVHEFVSSIVEDRKSWIDEILSGNITAAGICAHISAMQGGAEVEIPTF